MKRPTALPPGAFGTNYRLLKWAVESTPQLFTTFFNTCLSIGHHPRPLRNAVIAPIPKPRRNDMSHPKNYRPIALLETLSKLLEKIVTRRLIFEAGAHNIIPHSQFGGRDMSSCTDAALCMIHDIRSAWSHNQVASLLTLDVSGYFNNIDHARLLYTLERLGYSDNICSWLKSYLSSRTAQFRIDGNLCPAFELPCVRVPQGSPLSPILSSLYSIPLLITATDHQANHFAYINDFSILAFSNSYNNNVNIINNIVTNVHYTATQLGLDFELPKSDLIHFIRPRSNISYNNPKLTVHLDNTDVVIEPQSCIRWLGFYLDQKLTFQEHVSNMATKARATIAGLRLLANIHCGLSIKHARQLYVACVIPILTYGAPLWFLGRRQKSLTKSLEGVQNTGLRWMLGAFKSTPVNDMEHLAATPLSKSRYRNTWNACQLNSGPSPACLK
ncbi:hypothetical protein OPQ81_008049 [Rhizoctonia solani]|nr:hypothetical protein OPQ81_008049 [Rhizoctonia solani]